MLHEDAGPFLKHRSVSIVSWAPILCAGKDFETRLGTLETQQQATSKKLGQVEHTVSDFKSLAQSTAATVSTLRTDIVGDLRELLTTHRK